MTNRRGTFKLRWRYDNRWDAAPKVDSKATQHDPQRGKLCIDVPFKCWVRRPVLQPLVSSSGSVPILRFFGAFFIPLLKHGLTFLTRTRQIGKKDVYLAQRTVYFLCRTLFEKLPYRRLIVSFVTYCEARDILRVIRLGPRCPAQKKLSPVLGNLTPVLGMNVKQGENVFLLFWRNISTFISTKRSRWELSTYSYGSYCKKRVLISDATKVKLLVWKLSVHLFIEFQLYWS